MSLRSLTLPSVVVPISEGQSVRVRGLGFNALAALVRTHSDFLHELIEKSKAGGVGSEDILALIPDVASRSPRLIAEIICYATGEEPNADLVEIALSLPMPVQLEILEATFLLTFETSAAVGKFAETVVRMVRGVTQVLPKTS